MATAQPHADSAHTLEVRRTFKASREKVFRAWTRPEEMKYWCAPSAEYETSAEVDLRAGGSYRIEMKHTSGKVHTAVGVYREVVEPEKLVYSWSWEDGSVEETQVTVEFIDVAGSTELVLTHEFFPNGEARDHHRQGWAGCLGRLEEHLV